MKFFRSLKGRLAVIAAIAIVVTGTVVLLFTYFMARSVIREQVFESMAGVVSRARRETVVSVGSLNEMATSLATAQALRLDLEAYVSSKEGQARIAGLESLLCAQCPASGPVSGIGLFATDGALIASTKACCPDSGVENTPRSVLDVVRQDRSVATFTLEKQELIVVLGVPVTSPASGSQLGTLVVRATSPELQSELADTTGLGGTGRILLSDIAEGKVSVVSFHQAIKSGKPIEAGLLMRVPLSSELAPVKAASGEKGEGEGRGLLGSKVVSSYDYIPELAWGITATAESSEAFAPISRLRNISIVVILVLLIGGSALAFMIARTISRPLEELQDGVKALGGGDLNARVSIVDGTEVVALAEEFNRMADRLKELYDSLERKVEERTIELNEANQRLLELDDLKSEFVSMASHELRSPMASMKMGVSTVLREMVGPLNDDQKLMLEIAERNIDRLTKLTSELLDLTKIEAGQLDIEIQDCDVGDIVREVASSDAALAESKGLYLRVDAEPPALAACDHDRIYRVIQNLVSNAINFTHEGGVGLTVTREAEDVRTCVADTGVGIPAEHLPTIFEKWSRAHAETASEAKGTGLGLAICRGIVEAHGGEISIQSETGKGTTVCFTLPARSPDGTEEDPDSR